MLLAPEYRCRLCSERKREREGDKDDTPSPHSTPAAAKKPTMSGTGANLVSLKERVAAIVAETPFVTVVSKKQQKKNDQKRKKKLAGGSDVHSSGGSTSSGSPSPRSD